MNNQILDVLNVNMKYKLVIFLNFCLFLTACELIRPIEEEDPYLQTQESASPGQNVNPEPAPYTPSFPPPTPPASPPPAPQPGTNQYPGQNSLASQGNNILVQVGCCPCSANGHLVSIPKTQEASHNNRLRRECQNRICGSRYVCQEWEKQCATSPCSTHVLSQLPP